ncbi:MAG: creatininase family protein [Thermodesulfobacteriota bacterium]
MSDAAESWRDAHRLLEERVAALPGALREVLGAAPPRLAADPARVRRIVATGVGSSAAHARLLVALLEECGIAARFLPASALVAPPPADARADALVVFSQGLSPNARLALRDVERWAAVTLVTAVPAADGERAARGGEPPYGPLAERRREIALLEERGVAVVRMPGAEEYGTLVRLTGPLVGCATTIRLAQAACAAAGRPAAGLLPASLDADAVCARVAAAGERLAREHGDLDARALESSLAFLASGTYGELLANLRAKVVEGMLLPAPPVWDLLEFAHGPFQQAYDRGATLLALARDDAPGEAELLARLEGMLVAGRHRLVRLRSSLPGALALLEHEALLNGLVVRYVAERRIDQARWPGQGADRALYEVGRAGARAPREAAGTAILDAAARAASLDRLAWPDVADLVAAGGRTALLPLGSTEQHGPHLPLATDTLIADAVAERLCARSAGVLRLPALALGCAREHASFAGTLSLEEATLEAVLRDVARSLAAHGFARLLVFTAHGGNYGVLRAASARIASEVAPLRVEPFLDAARLGQALLAAGARFGVAADAAGQHAGETETSIVAALAPALVRRERLRPGLVGLLPPADELFYPDLRRHAPDGTVGDPCGASAARADAYLDAWVDVLVDAWSLDQKKRK